MHEWLRSAPDPIQGRSMARCWLWKVGFLGQAIELIGSPSGSGFARVKPAASAISSAWRKCFPTAWGTIKRSEARYSVFIVARYCPPVKGTGTDRDSVHS